MTVERMALNQIIVSMAIGKLWTTNAAMPSGIRFISPAS
jgi:hypothetical protein